MQVCFIADTLYNYLNPEVSVPAGGAQRQQYLLTQALQERGVSVSAIVGDYGQPDGVEYQGVTTYTGCPKNGTNLTDVGSKFYHLFQAIRRADADLYYVRGAPRLYMATRLLTKVLGKDLVFCIANDSDIDQEYLHSRYGERLTNVYFRLVQAADVIIAQTDDQQALIRENTGRHAEVIPNGYPLPPTGDVLPHEEREFILWVGSSQPEKKRPEKYLQVARDNPDVPFVMVVQQDGDGVYEAELASAASEISNLEYNVDVDPDEVHEYFRRAALLVNTSQYEGFPNTYLEAWRYETPVVTLTHSLSGTLHDAEFGVVSGLESELSRVVFELWGDLERRSRMGGSAREYTSNHYSMGEVADQYENIFVSALRQRPVRHANSATTAE